MKEKGALKQNKVPAEREEDWALGSSFLGPGGGEEVPSAAWLGLDSWSHGLLPPFLPSQEALDLAFSILYDPDETLNFIAPNKYEVRGGGGWEGTSLAQEASSPSSHLLPHSCCLSLGSPWLCAALAWPVAPAEAEPSRAEPGGHSWTLAWLGRGHPALSD